MSAVINAMAVSRCLCVDVVEGARGQCPKKTLPNKNSVMLPSNVGSNVGSPYYFTSKGE